MRIGHSSAVESRCSDVKECYLEAARNYGKRSLMSELSTWACDCCQDALMRMGRTGRPKGRKSNVTLIWTRSTLRRRSDRIQNWSKLTKVVLTLYQLGLLTRSPNQITPMQLWIKSPHIYREGLSSPLGVAVDKASFSAALQTCEISFEAVRLPVALGSSAGE